MDLKPGYRQTEIGVLPQDWSVTTVGDEFSVQLGKMLDSEKNVGLPKPYLGNRAIQWGRIELADIGVVKMTPSDLLRFRLRKGDLLVCEGGEVGRAAIWTQPMQECYYQKALHRLRPTRSYNVVLMLNMLQRLAATGVLLNFVTQTSIAHLPKDKFEKVPLPLPPTSAEQAAIADALSDADALIESLEQLIAKKRHLKQGAMQELLTGKRRLPGFADGNDRARADWHLPDGWTLNRVGDFATAVASGKSRVGSEFGDYPVHGSTGIIGRCLKADYSGRAVLIARVGANAGKLTMVDGEYGVTDNTIIVRIDESLEHEYFWRQLSAMRLNSLVFGSGQPLITGTQIKNLSIPFPPTKGEQAAIAAVLSDMDAEVAALETKLTKARQIKQGMMQNLLTGRIRLV